MDEPVNTRRFEGARLQAAAFPDDTGEPSAEVAAALASYAAGTGSHADVLAALGTSRLLVPVVALLGEVEHDERGLAHDKSSDMAAVLITGRDGRKALLSFTSTAALRAWSADARPVGVPARQAARAALQDGAEALLVDLAGPVLFAVEGQDLRDLADGLVLRRVGDTWAWTRSVGG
jgi:hypothetical protein